MKSISEPALGLLRFFSLLLLAIHCRLDAAIIINPWTPIFKGVEFATGEADQAEPLLQKVQVLRVDLQDPDIEFLGTPPDITGGLETMSETTSEFLTRNGLQAAINANFFAPCCSLTPEPKELIGLSMSEGVVVSPPVGSGTGSQVLLIKSNNIATIASTTASFDTNPYWTAVAGSHWVVQNGVMRTNLGSSDFLTNTHPRTAVGITQNGRYLLLMTIDGRQPGYSAGAPMPDVAHWLVRFGAHNGLNLDGGGSTTMVREENGQAVELNSPSGSRQRMVGNNLGLRAKPLPLTIVSPPQTQTVLIQQNVNFSLQAISPQPLVYQWQFNGTDIPGATNSSHILTNAQLSHSGDYTVIVSDLDETNILTAHLTVTDEIIVPAAEAELAGSWTLSAAGTSKFSSSFYYSVSQPGIPTAEAVFRPNFPVAGQWDVSIWYSAGPTRSTNVPVAIFFQGGGMFTNINQTAGGGSWRQVASRFNFPMGTDGFVELSNATGETNRLIIADAVRFRYRPNPPEVNFTGAGFTNGALHILLNGETGVRHVIEASTNLVNWVALTNFVMMESGFHFAEIPYPNLRQRFYRARLEP